MHHYITNPKQVNFQQGIVGYVGLFCFFKMDTRMRAKIGLLLAR